MTYYHVGSHHAAVTESDTGASAPADALPSTEITVLHHQDQRSL